MNRREIYTDGELAFVPLTRGHTAIIDASDVHLVEGVSWAAIVRGRHIYAGRSVWGNGTNAVVLMHRVIMSAGPSQIVDHRDGNGLMNRRENLRLASKSQNAMNSGPHIDNSSGAKGVHWSKQRKRWRAEICAGGVRKHLGLFDTVEAASAAYQAAADAMHGEFARSK